MNKGIIIVLALVLLLGGATFLYGTLSTEIAPEQLAEMQTQEVSKPEAPMQEETDQAAELPEESNAAANKLAAPDFTVYDAAGNAVCLSDFFGKPIVLNFWASWCGPCCGEMPEFDEKYRELGSEVQFIMLNMTVGRETKESADKFLAEQDFAFPVYFDLNADAAYTYGASTLPVTFFIDAEGYLTAQAVGRINGETLQRGIDMIYSAE